MKFKEGDKVLVKHSRSGTWKGIVSKDFDTEKNEWYSVKLNQSFAQGISNNWEMGENMPCRRGLCTISLLEDEE